MIKKLLLFGFIIALVAIGGCVKDTYDMKLLSKKAHLSPTLVLSVVKGDITLGDIVKQNDTVVFEQDNFVKIVFRKDSVIDLKLSDFYDLNNMVSFSQSYALGDLSIDPFNYSTAYTLDQIRNQLGEPLKTTFGTLNGTTSTFPPFPSVNLGNISFPVITNFENAVFSSGYMVISIKNNLTAPLMPVKVKLFNAVDNSAIGTEVIISTIQPGQTQSASIDLTNKTVTKSIYAAVVLTGSPGNTTPTPIDIYNNNIQITMQGTNLVVKSGRVILPPNTFAPLDYITIDPGSGVELDELKILNGDLSYHIQKPASLSASLTVSLPEVIRSGSPVSELINLGSGSLLDGNISFNNSIIDLGSDPGQAYNRVPYSISISSTGMVDFNSTDVIKIDFNLLSPDFDYVKGYFGKQTKAIEPDSLDLDIADILNHITGEFLLTSPSIKVDYSNSFAIPIMVDLKATGKRNAVADVNLDYSPVTLSSPVYPTARDISGSFIIDKTNSSLPELISMLPEKINFSGSAEMNPAPVPGVRNNYVFGNSRFLGSLEVEVPLEFRIKNLQFTDTVDNFMIDKGSGSDNPIKPENFDLLRIDIRAKNGFPLGASISMELYDPITKRSLSKVDAKDIIKPAPVDNNGKVKSAEVTEASTSIEFTKDFFSSINRADKIIFRFTLNTTDSNLNKDVKIYSDYHIDFKASLVVKPEIIVDLK